MNSLPKTVTRQRRGCDLNPGPSTTESSALTIRLPSHHFRGLRLLYRTLIGNPMIAGSQTHCMVSVGLAIGTGWRISLRRYRGDALSIISLYLR